MIPHSITSGDITHKDLGALAMARDIIEQIADNDPNKITCHILARLVAARVPGTKCIDGHFVGGWRHSWVKLPSRNILDVYPIAASNPFIVVGQNNNRIFQPWAKFYIENKLDFTLEPAGHPDEAARKIRPQWFQK